MPDDTQPSLDLEKLSEGLEPGTWVAVSADRERRVAVGQSVDDVIANARAAGHAAAIYFCVSKRTFTGAELCLPQRSATHPSRSKEPPRSRRGA